MIHASRIRAAAGRLAPSGTRLRSSMSATKSLSIRKITEGSLHLSKPTWWLESRFHFSFAEYYNPKNFGALRVLNDDLVKGHSGFGAHAHRDAEIFSYIVDGQLSHADSMGNREALPRGCVQYLSAGTGIRHSEMNEGDETTRFLQIWVTPDRSGHVPQYGSKAFTQADRRNKLLQILEGTGSRPQWEHVNSVGEPIRLHQDVNVFVSEAEAGVSQTVTLGEGRQAYLVAIEGSLTVDDVQLDQRDAAELVNRPGAGPVDVQLTACNRGAHFMLIEIMAV